MEIQVRAWKCEICGHEWMCGEKTVPPSRCAKCRKRTWHGQESPRAESPKPQNEGMGGVSFFRKIAEQTDLPIQEFWIQTNMEGRVETPAMMMVTKWRK